MPEELEERVGDSQLQGSLSPLLCQRVLLQPANLMPVIEDPRHTPVQTVSVGAEMRLGSFDRHTPNVDEAQWRIDEWCGFIETDHFEGGSRPPKKVAPADEVDHRGK